VFGTAAELWAADSASRRTAKVHAQYWEQLLGRDREETARRAGCIYLPECDSFTISLLSTEYAVYLGSRTISDAAEPPGSPPAGFLEQLCVLAYLVGARDQPLAGKLVSAEKLDPGGFFFRGSHRIPVEKLEKAFGCDSRLLDQAGSKLNAKSLSFGDAAIEILVLPRIPLTLIIWVADQEFPARASILFDQTVSAHLPLDVVYAAALLTIDAVLSNCSEIS
jgi:hypothetical protein